MTVTTTDVQTRTRDQSGARLRQAQSAIRALAAAIGARWRAAIASGQLGPDEETIIGRGTGARI